MAQTTDLKNEQELIACDICMKEIPVSAAKNDETSDYVFHFCGIDCYAKWKEQESQSKQQQKTE